MASTVITTVGASTWSWPAGVTEVVAECLGGGGGGGTASGNPATGGGGKGGSYAKVTITKGAETTLAIVVGGPGAVAAAGGFSSVTQDGTVRALAPGGGGGASQAANSANGAGATTLNGTAVGTVIFEGGNGGTGNFTSAVQGSGAGGGAAGTTGNGTAGNVNVAGAKGPGTFVDGVIRSGNGAAGVGDSTVGIAPQGNPFFGGGASGGKANNNTDRGGWSGRQGVVVLTFTLPPITDAYGLQVIADGAVGYWRFAAGLYLDSVGTAHGTLTSGTHTVVAGNGNLGEALSFTGATGVGKVTIPHAAAHNLGTDGSLECWVKVPAGVANQEFFAKGAYGVGWGYGLGLMSGGSKLAWRSGGGEYCANTTFPRDVWVHIVATANDSPTDYKLYINGVLYTGTFTWVGQAGPFFASLTEPMSVGHARGSTPEYVTGAVDEIAIYPTILTPAQVADHYAKATGGGPVDQAITTGSIGTAYAKAVLADGAAGYWRFAGGSLQDSAGSAHGSVTSGALTIDPGAVDQALTFGGAAQADQVTIPHAAALNLTAQGSLEFWIKLATLPSEDMTLFAKGSYGVEWAYGVGIWTNGYLFWRRNLGDYIAQSNLLPLNAWAHVVMTVVDATDDFKLYVNGVLYTGAHSIIGTDCPFFLSSTQAMGVGFARAVAPPGEYFKGSLDEIAIYPTVLTPAQIDAHIAARLSPDAMFAPSVALAGAAQDQAITGATIPSTVSVRVPIVAPGAVTLTGATRSAASALYTPTLGVGPVTVTAPVIPTSALVRAPSLAVGAVAVTGATRPSTVTVHSPGLAVGPVAIAIAFIATGSLVTAPTVVIGAGAAQAITGATIGGAVSTLPATIAYWPFNEGTGPTALDASGGGHHATLIGGRGLWDTSALKKFGAAAITHSADDSDAMAVLDADWDIGNIHTVSVWINGWNGSDDGVVFGSFGLGDYPFYLDATDWYYSASQGNYVSVPHGGLTGSHHLCVSRNGTAGVTFYKDGVDIGTRIPANAASGLAVRGMGAYGNGQFPFHGTLDDLRIYNVAFSAAQVAELYALNPDVPAGAVQAFAPGVAQIASTEIGGAFRSTTLQLFAPVATADALVTVSFITSSGVARAPVVLPGAVVVTSPIIVPTVQTFIPSVSVGPVAVTASFLPSAVVVFAPHGGTSTPIAAAFVAASTAVHAPSVTATPTIGLPTIPSTARLHGDSLWFEQAVVGDALTAYQAGLNNSQTISGHAGWLTSASLLLRRVGTPTDAVFIELHDGAMTGPLLSRSPSILCASIPTVATWINFPVPGGVVLQAGTTYWIEIFLTRAANDVGNPLFISYSYSESYPGGQFTNRLGGLIESGADACFRLYTGNSHTVVAVPVEGIVTATIPAGAMLFAPLAAPGPVAIGGPTRTSAAQLFGPAITPGAVTIAGAMQFSTATLFTPTVAALGADQAIALPTILNGTSGAALNRLRLNVNRLNETSSQRLFPPSLFVPEVMVGGIASTVGLYPPAVAVGAVAITTSGVPSTAHAYAPDLDVRVAVGGIVSTAVVAPPALSPVSAVMTAFIAGGSQAQAPEIAGEETIAVGGIGATAAVYGPRLTAQQPIEIQTAFIPSQTFLHLPVVAPGPLFVTASYIANTTQAYAPALAPAITTPALPSGAVLHAPSVTPGSVTVTLSYVPSGSRVHAPALAAALVTPFIPAGAVLFGPALQVGIGAGTIGSTVTVFAPRIAHAAIGAHIPSTNWLYPPTLISLNVGGSTLTNLSTLFPPALAPLAFVTTGFITSVTAAHAPSLATGAVTVTVPTIVSTVVLYPPSALPRVALPFIATTAVLFPPLSVTTGPVTVTLPIIATTAQASAPSVVAVVAAPSIASTAAIFPPTLGTAIAVPCIFSTVRFFTLRVDLTADGATILSTAALYPPVVIPETIGAFIASTALLFPPDLKVVIVTPPWVITTVLFPPAYVSTAAQVVEDFESAVCQIEDAILYVKQQLLVSVEVTPSLDVTSEVCRTVSETVAVLRQRLVPVYVAPLPQLDVDSTVRRMVSATVYVRPSQQQSVRTVIVPLLEFPATVQATDREVSDTTKTEDVLV